MEDSLKTNPSYADAKAAVGDGKLFEDFSTIR
jgi:hypothetical protein